MLFIDLNANDTDVHNKKKDTLHRFWNRILNSFSIDENGVLCLPFFQLNIYYSVFKRQLSKYDQVYRRILLVYGCGGFVV